MNTKFGRVTKLAYKEGNLMKKSGFLLMDILFEIYQDQRLSCNLFFKYDTII